MRLSVLAALLALVGCGVPDPHGSEAADGETGDGSETGGDSETGDGSETGEPEPIQSFPDIDLDEWCDVESPPLSVVDTHLVQYGVEDIGPCGHVVSKTRVDDVTEMRLTMPDGSSKPLPFHPAWPKFDVTGRQLLLHGPSGNDLELHDLATGTFRSFDFVEANAHGFVRSAADPEQPTVAWLVDRDARLLKVTVEQTTELMTDVLSPYAVAGSLGNNKVLTVRGAQMYVIDVDSGEALPTEVDDFYIGYTPNGEKRWDGLRIDYSGSLGMHELSVLVPSEFDPEGEYQQIEDRVIDLHSGEVVAVCDWTTRLLQAPTEKAPSFVLCNQQVLVWLDGELELVSEGPVHEIVLSDSGTLVFTINIGQGRELVRVGAEAPTLVEPIAMVESGEPSVSANGQVIAHSNPTDVCADAMCTQYLHELIVWTADAGVASPTSWAGPAQIRLVLDDGTVLLRGIPVEGPIDGPLPEPALWSIAADGHATAWEFSEEQFAEFSGIQQLADGRLLVLSTPSDFGLTSLWTIDLTTTDDPIHIFGPAGGTFHGWFLDGQRRRVAFGAESELYFGQL